MQNQVNHLKYSEKVNFGSYYTPKKYVDIVKMWMHDYAINGEYTIFDPSCGYGAFFQLKEEYERNRYIGNDIDVYALKKANEYFPFVELSNKNIFENITRESYNIKENEKLIIVGNPPYNDVTSQIHQSIKNKVVKMDEDVKTRDYGMSSLLAYDKLKADYVIILHPLSYLIKKTNFNTCNKFYKNYQLVEHVIFNSQEFADTSKSTGFPILVGMYKRNESNGLSYNDVLNYKFRTVEGKSFIINDRDYVCKYISKYPSRDRFNPEILFYTLRDINALKRSRTFIKNRENNAVDVNPQKLSYYCYIDCFKEYADIPYYMGNFDIPFVNDDFKNIESDVINISMNRHKDIFGNNHKEPTSDSIDKVKKYIAKAIMY